MTATLKLIESSRTKKWPEHRIISTCVRIATIIAGRNAAFATDPTGNNDFAERLDDLSWDERVTMVGTLADLQAKSPAGLAAKAQLAIFILDDRVHHQLNENEAEYFIGFARDVRAFMKDLVQNTP
jgi:hypothetical protein